MAGGEVSVGYLADELGESQPKVSRHLSTLRTMGLVSTRREGKWVYYAIDRQESPTADAILSLAVGNTAALTHSSMPDSAASYEPWVRDEMEVWLL
jgi:ArsR family transcriptional regulator